MAPRKKKAAAPPVSIDGVTTEVADVQAPPLNGGPFPPQGKPLNPLFTFGSPAVPSSWPSQTTPFAPLAPSAPIEAPAAAVSLKTNVKGVQAEIPIGALNILTGGNRRGKTAVLDAIRLALTGKHPIGPHAANLMELAPEGATELYAMLVAEGWSAHFEMKAGKKPPERSELFGALKGLTELDRERILPSITMRSFLVGDKKAREAVFKRFGQAVMAKGVPMPAGLNAEQTALWNRAAQEIQAETSDPAETVSEINGWMRREKLAAGKQISALSAQLEQAQTELAMLAAGAELIPQLELQYKQAVVSEGAEGTRQHLAAAEADLQRLEVEAQTFVAAQPAFDAQQQAAVAAIASEQEANKGYRSQLELLISQHDAFAPRLQRIVAIDDVLDAMEKAQSTTCPLCRADGVKPAAMRAEIQALLAERRHAQSTLNAQIQTVRTALQSGERNVQGIEGTMQVNKATRERQLTSIKMAAGNAQARIDLLKQTLGGAASYAGPPSQAIRAQIEGLQKGEAVRAQVGQLEVGIRQRKNDQAAAKTLEEEAERTLQALLTVAAAGAEAAVNKYLPQGFKAVLDLSGGGCEWRLIGADGRPHTRHAMSGAEKASLMVALACAWTEGAPIRVLTLDDEDLGPFHTDPANLQLFLAKIKEVTDAKLLTAVFAAGVLPHEVPAGWNEIKR